MVQYRPHIVFACRPKCSVSSPLIVPGPCGKTELRPEGELDTAETIKEEQRRTVDGHGGSYSGHTLKIRSASGSAALTHPGRSKHRTDPRKRTSRQSSSLVPRTQTQDKVRAAPSIDVFLSTGVAEPTGPVTTEGTAVSASHVHNVYGQNEASSNRLSVVADPPDGRDEKQDSSASDAGGDAEPGRTTGSEPEEEAEQSFSSLQKIWRKTRAYKRKRRKVEPGAETNIEASLLKLWKLFQSSDDSDVEFLGFGDQDRSSGCCEDFQDCGP